VLGGRQLLVELGGLARLLVERNAERVGSNGATNEGGSNVDLQQAGVLALDHGDRHGGSRDWSSCFFPPQGINN